MKRSSSSGDWLREKWTLTGRCIVVVWVDADEDTARPRNGLRMGIEVSALSRLETFKVKDPGLWTICRWAEALDCTIPLPLVPDAKPVEVT